MNQSQGHIYIYIYINVKNIHARKYSLQYEVAPHKQIEL